MLWAGFANLFVIFALCYCIFLSRLSPKYCTVCAKWCTKMWENCQYFARPVRYFFTFKKYYSHCPFSCRSWPMGFNLTRSYMCILSRVRDQRTHIHSQWLLRLRIVNYSHAFEREKSKWWRVSDCARGKKNDWLKINSVSCHINFNLPFTGDTKDNNRNSVTYSLIQTVIQFIYTRSSSTLKLKP